jgi:uncharacterized protein (DUF1330 family)
LSFERNRTITRLVATDRGGEEQVMPTIAEGGSWLNAHDSSGKGEAMAAYLIYQAEVLDPDLYEAYKTAAGPSVGAAGGRYLVRGGDGEALEGQMPASRTVILEFPSREMALKWYRGAEYTEIRKLRAGIAEATLYVVDGTD